MTEGIRLRYVHKGGTSCTPRECLWVVENGWLFSNQIKKAREVADKGTDEECEKYLEELEKSATSSLNLWRLSQ